MITSLDLAGRWMLRADAADVGVAEDWSSGAWDDAVEADVPAPWQDALGEDAPGVVWYRRSMQIPAEWSKGESRVWLRLDSVATDCRGWVNGVEVGRHVGDYVPFRFDVTKATGGGDELEITLRVDQMKAGKPTEGWLQKGHITKGFHDVLSLAHGGVWQGVRLELTGPVSIIPDGVAVRADPATGEVEIRVETEGSHREARLEGEVIDERGAVVARVDAALGEPLVAHVPTPEIWSTDRPSLYAARVRVATPGAPAQQSFARFGFRTIETGGPGNERILLNGQPIFLSGVLDWGHEPAHGSPSPTPTEVRERFAHLRRMGFNCVCLCMWYAPRWFYDIADEMGMLLWQEHPIWQSDMSDEHVPEYQRLCAAFMRRDRNHPSVVIVSATCEHPKFNPVLAKWWWQRAREQMPRTLLQVQTASFAWADHERTDLHDEHTYEDAPRWATYLKDLQAELGEHAAAGRPRPFVMGESVLYTSWPDTRAILKRVGTKRPWWLPKGFDACVAFEDELRTREGDEVAERFMGQGRRFHLLGRKFQLERFRECANHAGLVQNHLRDVPACRCGFMDDVDRWVFAPERTRPWLAPGMLVLRTPGNLRAVEAGSTVECELLVSNFTGAEIDGAVLLSVDELPVSDARISCARGETSTAPFTLPVASAATPTKLSFAAELAGAERNQWDLWSLPGPEIARHEATCRRLDAPEIDPETVKLDVERGYSKGFGLPAPSAPFSTPDAGRACPELPAIAPGERVGADVRTVVTHRLTPELVDHVERGGRVVMLASNAPGGIGSVAEWHFGCVPLIFERGPLSEGDSEWVLDLLLVDLIANWCRALPSEKLGIADRVEPIIRQVFTHDQARPVMLDLLSSARVGDGLLVISSLDHTTPAGRFLMSRVLEWLGDDNASSDGALDVSVVRSWCAPD
jgi:hypothetical protein